MSANTRRATPERTLFVFAAFVLLAAVSAVRDCQRRETLERAAPVAPAEVSAEIKE